MELSNNINIENWYTNSNINPNNYWPLDYPPMSGYHAYIIGIVIKFFIPESILLKSSWGYESLKHKILMRMTVILSDLIFFHIPIYFLLKKIFLKQKHLNNENKKSFKIIITYLITYCFILFSPSLNIIDHGHFQYNCVMHGLFYFAVYLMLRQKFILTIIIYSFCINFKQMGMYFSLTFLFFVLNKLINLHNKKEIEINKKINFVTSIIYRLFYILIKVLIYSFATISINSIIWMPWIRSNKINDVLGRIFPLWRGIFEDKVFFYLLIYFLFL